MPNNFFSSDVNNVFAFSRPTIEESSDVNNVFAFSRPTIEESVLQ